MAVHRGAKTTHSEGAIRLQVMQSSQVRGGGESGVEARLHRGEVVFDKYTGLSEIGSTVCEGESLPTQTGDTAFIASKQSTDIS